MIEVTGVLENYELGMAKARGTGSCIWHEKLANGVAVEARVDSIDTLAMPNVWSAGPRWRWW